MVVSELNIDYLRNLNRSNRIIIRGVENHYDVISSNVVLIHGYLTSILGPLMIQASTGAKVINEVILDKMVLVLRHTLALCEACNYELPDEASLLEFYLSINHTVKSDSILILTDMMISALSILHVVFVDLDGVPVWTEEEVPDELQNNIITIILGIRNLGKKHGFTIKDVISKLI